MAASWRVAAAIAVSTLIVGLTVTVATGVVTPFDLAVNASLDPYRAHWLLTGFLWLTIMGTEAAVLAMSLATSVLLWSVGRTAFIRPLWITVLGAEAMTWAMKFAVGRPRPASIPDVATALSPSYPSAHAAGTTAIIGMLAVLAGSGRPERRTVIACVAAAFGLVVAASRIVLGVHYLSDVLGGLLVGGLWLIAGTSAEAFHPRHV